jgi:hypothetical protein
VLNPNSTEVPVYAIRLSSSSRARQLYPERLVFRVLNQSIRVRVYIGRASDFAITGGTWETPSRNRGTLIQENKGTGGEMSWTPTDANLSTVVNDVMIPAANETKEYNIETFFTEGDSWVGIDGDGEQRYLVITGESEAGTNGSLAVWYIHGREEG